MTSLTEGEMSDRPNHHLFRHKWIQ